MDPNEALALLMLLGDLRLQISQQAATIAQLHEQLAAARNDQRSESEPAPLDIT